MAEVDVLGCVAAVVSAFHGAADLCLAITSRHERRRRMNGVAQDPEEAFGEKLLLKSLADGEEQCKSARDKWYRQYGSTFKAGDAQALSALKNAMISLQMDVVSALQVARAVENAKLDIARLHEAAIVNKNATLRAMDNLCKRLPEPVPGAMGQLDHVDSSRTTLETSGQVRMTGVDRPLAVTVPSDVAASSKASPIQQRPSARRRSQSDDQAATSRKVAPPKKRGLARMFSELGASLSMANDDYSAFAREAQDLRERTIQESEVLKQAVQQRRSADKTNAEADRSSGRSKHDSTFSGSDSSSRHRPTTSTHSTIVSEDGSVSCYSELSGDSQRASQNDKATGAATSISSDLSASWKDVGVPVTSSIVTPAREDTRLPIRRHGSGAASFAPEVVGPGHEAMPYMPGSTSPRRPSTALSSSTHRPRDVHPALRDIWSFDPTGGLAESEFPYAAFRSAHPDIHHNLCTGARETRERFEDGLTIAMMPAAHDPTTSVPYRKCKYCHFRSRLPTDPSAPSDPIHALSNGIRYRWLFLVKSHMPAGISQSKLDAYSYGCLFCTAEGRETAVHPGLEPLMHHILSRHRTVMMTPEVRWKTKCIIGGVTDGSEWDIDLPGPHKEKTSLSTLFTRR